MFNLIEIIDSLNLNVENYFLTSIFVVYKYGGGGWNLLIWRLE